VSASYTRRAISANDSIRRSAASAVAFFVKKAMRFP